MFNVEMDWTYVIVCVVVVFLMGLIFVGYKIGVREKTYDEVLAEKRQQTSALFVNKTKPKEKKAKKANKKLKEKSDKVETEEIENVDNKENIQSNKPHVEFKDEAEEVLITDESTVPLLKEPAKPKKTKKVRPILINKKEQSPQRHTLVADTPMINHFEENPPKDDFELLRSNSKDDIFKQEPVKEKPSKDKKQREELSVNTKNKKNTKTSVDAPKPEPVEPVAEEIKPEQKVVAEVVSSVPQINSNGNAGKEKKKKKSEYNTKQQLAAEKDALIDAVRRAEWSVTEIQLLTDYLLNVSNDARHTPPADWSEGKSDPMQKMKKQLAEKEKQLTELQETLIGAQARLKEVRSEQQTERAQLQLKIRSLEELVQTKQIEIQASNNRFQVNNQKIQQLQTDLNAEMMKTHKVMEDNAALQMQIQQYEVNLVQMQETENMILKQRSENEELKAQLQQMIAEREHQHQQHQHFMMQMSSMENSYKDSNQELERNLERALRQESDWKREQSSLNSTLQKQFEEQRNLEHRLGTLNDQLRQTSNEKSELSKLNSQLKSELKQTQEELAALAEASVGTNNHEVEIRNLSNELSSTRNELSSKIEELQQTEKKYKTELETSNKKYLLVQKELEEQKTKNNDLRTKNWKVMEALRVAESKTDKHDKGSQSPLYDHSKITNDIISQQQESQKQLMQRLFPDIEDLKSLNSDDWQDRCVELISNYISNLKEKEQQQSTQISSTEVEALHSEIRRLKEGIDDSACVLNDLMTKTNQAELTWMNSLADKEAELQDLKEVIVKELKTKLENVEAQLAKEREEKRILSEKCQSQNTVKTQHTVKTQNGNVDPLSTIERLTEENSRLREQLRMEQNKNEDVGANLKNHNNSTPRPGLTEVVPSAKDGRKICSNMECQFLYCDGDRCNNKL